MKKIFTGLCVLLYTVGIFLLGCVVYEHFTGDSIPQLAMAAIKDEYEFTGEGESMQPTISDKDTLTLKTSYYENHEVEVGDIVKVENFWNDENVCFVKRVVAVPGDNVSLKAGRVYVNGKQMKDSASLAIITPEDGAVESYTLKEDEYYVLGDNRSVSLDSSTFGVVKKEYIKGKIVAVNGEAPKAFVE